MENNKEIVIFINGFLNSIACLNSYSDDGKTYYIALLEKLNNSYQDTIRKHLNVTQWNTNTKKLYENWKVLLKKDLFDYFNQNKTLTLDSLEKLYENLFEKLEKLILYPCEFYKVDVDWTLNDIDKSFYECYQNDYLFDLGNQILFLHFGSTD